MEKSRSAAPTMSYWPLADITPICTRNSFWKKSWNAHERFEKQFERQVEKQSARRRGAGQGIRLAFDAAALAVHGALQVVGSAGPGLGCGRHSFGTGTTAHVSERD